MTHQRSRLLVITTHSTIISAFLLLSPEMSAFLHCKICKGRGFSAVDCYQGGHLLLVEIVVHFKLGFPRQRPPGPVLSAS